MKNPGPKTTFEVGMLAGDSWKTVLIVASAAIYFLAMLCFKLMDYCFHQVKSSKGNDNGITNKSKLQAPIVDPNPKVCLNYDPWFLRVDQVEFH
jgi:U3 small nucleolar RNA-associated protein 14